MTNRHVRKRDLSAAALAAACVFAPSLLGGGPAPEAGAIEGRVRFDGPPPAGTFVPESGGTQKTLNLDANGFVQYVVVFLPDGGSKRAAPTAPVTLDQRHFVFHPPVLAIRAGQPVRFTNADAANHNVRARDVDPANTFSVNTAAGDASGRRMHRFAVTTHNRPIVLTCDIHPWMTAWVYPFEHDLFAVTDAAGRFRIDGVPAGRHRLAVRQPAAPLERNLAVDVRAGAATQIEIRFSARDIGMPAAFQFCVGAAETVAGPLGASRPRCRARGV